MESNTPFSQRPFNADRTAHPFERTADYMQFAPPPPPQGPSMTVGDIYYVLFRHKWKILLCSLAGVLAAVGVYILHPPPYQSEAKLFIRYVATDNRTPGPSGDTTRIQSPDRGGETIMDSEEEILTSLDLSTQVAEAIGPERILAKVGGGKDLNRAAFIVKQGLLVDVPPRSSVIRILFRHRDPEIVQPVLREVIDRYFKMHVDIHRAVGIMGDILTQETDQLRARLAQTEDDLRKARNKAGVISLDDSKKAFSEQMARIREEIFAAQAELAERAAVYEELTKNTNSTTGTGTAPSGPDTPVPPEKIDEYRSISSRLDLFRKREQDLLEQFTPENVRVKYVRDQITEAEATKRKLEADYPKLARTIVVPTGTPGALGTQPGGIDLATEGARLTALQSKIKVLNAQLDQVRTEAANVDQMEGSIQELRRKRDLEEANYRYYAATLEQSRINEALGSGKVSNISPIQEPTPPLTDRGKVLRVVGMIAFGGIAVGLGWAFLIELYLDRTVRRPREIEQTLGVPLFLSVPDLSGRNKKYLPASKQGQLSLEAPKANGSAPPMKDLPARSDSSGVMTSVGETILNTFHETLRDRLIGYFERRNLTHKPKLVAVTGLGRNGGVTTTAAGLASCLSQTGEGNVLLVDMTAGQGSAQQFYRGKEVCGLEQILTTRDSAQVEDNLYVVAEEPSGDKLSRILPQRFTKLVPKLKASNFDYIIFDMPPVSQISITPRLAGFMDMVLLVIESEKTDRDVVQRAVTMLAESKAHVGAVLNKTKSYLPARLDQEA